jgi:hypothetical protein
MQDLLVTPGGRVVYPVLKGTLIMRIAFGTASEPHLFAEIVAAFEAQPAMAA